MPPDDVQKTPEDEPVTPELATNGSSNPGDIKKVVLPPTAPKGKPKAPPLIHGKIKINDEGSEVTGGSGSKIPLLKTKHLDPEHQGESRKRVSHFSNTHNGSSVKRESRVVKSTMEVHRTVEKVKLSKGIEMRRVVQESNGIKSKRYNTTVQNSKTASVLASAKDSSQGCSNGTQRRKMTKVEASFPEVKSFTGHGHVRPSGSGSNLACKSKSNEACNLAGSESNKKVSPVRKSEPLSSKPAIPKETKPNPETKPSDTTPGQNPVAPPQTEASAVDFKTVDEFLKMPETSLPEAKAHSPVKKTVYKSKFWEYIDPKKSNSKSRSSSKEQKKPYDPDAVKTFMQKQKESRKVQQMRESKEREAESAKRQRMLKELDSKCQKLALKGRLLRGSGEEVASAHNLEEDIKKPKLEIPSQSPSMKYLKPLLERKQGSILMKSDVAKQSQYLLAEFENIVKRECISFLQKIPASQTNVSSPVEKVDKAVATSVSLLELSSIDSEKKQSQSEDGINLESLEHDELKLPRIPSPSAVEKAASKIQAFYRGYKVRQALKEANLFYRKPIPKRCSELVQQNAANKSVPSNQNRRWSFPRMPEKPYDNLSRLLPMSPIPMAGNSFDFSVPCYIPPPTTMCQAPRSPARPRVLPTFPLTPSRVYNEPYPKVDRKSTGPMDRANSNINTPVNSSLPSLHQMDTGGSSTRQSAEVLQNLNPRNSSNGEFEFIIPSSIPSIVDVLREKLRLFSSDSNDRLAPRNSGPGASGMVCKEDILSNQQLVKEKSPEDGGSRKILSKESGDLSTTTNDDYGVNHEDGITPKIKRHKRRSRPRSQRSPVGDSTTTVETDGDIVPSATRSSPSVARKQKRNGHTSTSGSKSEETIRSSTLNDATTTSSFENFLAPALQLRYEAEREHLKIIEKALQVRLHSNLPNAGSADSVPNNEQPQPSCSQESVKKSSPETDRVQLAIANCQKESMKAAAEMAKWMSEFQKTTKEHERVQVPQAPVDLAATVIAAVEQARVIGIEKRKEKRLQEESRHKPQDSRRHPNYRSLSDSSQSSEVIRKVDKSVETSLTLVKDFDERLIQKAKRRDYKENSGVSRCLKDYQQQFPSESERDSPIPVTQAVPSADPPQTAQAGMQTMTFSRHSSPEDGFSKFQDPIDYPSIIPSGNSVDFTSLDPRVSTLDYISQIESEKDGTCGETSIVEDIHDEPVSMQKPTHQASVSSDIISEHSRSAKVHDEASHHSTIIDEAETSKSSNFITDVSKSQSPTEQPVSEHSEVVKTTSFHSSMEVEDEIGESDRAISTESKIEEILSENPEFIDTVSQQSKIEEDILNFNLTDNEENVSAQSKIVEDLSNQSNLPQDSPKSEIKEELSVVSNIESKISDHSTVKEEISQQSETASKPKYVEKTSLQEIHDEEVSDNFESEGNISDDQFDVVEDKATETELPEDNESISDNELSRSKEVEEKSGHESFQSIVEDLVKKNQNQDVAIVDEEVPDTTNIPERVSEKEQDKEPSIVEDLHDIESEDENGVISHEGKVRTETSQQAISQDSMIQDVADSESKFEEDIASEQSKLVEENVSEIFEEYKSSPEFEEPSKSILTNDKSISHRESEEKQNAELELVKTPLKPPPPPYSPPSLRESDSQNSDAKVSFDSQSPSAKDESSPSTQINENNSLERVIKERTPSNAEQADIPKSSLVDEISEKPQFEDDISEERSQILDETSVSERSNKEGTHPPTEPEHAEISGAGKNEDQQTVNKLETEPKPQLSKPEFEVPLKPPPPYSPPSSLDSTSLSTPSLIVSLPDEKLENIAREQANIIWEVWKSGTDDPDSFPDINKIMNVMYEKGVVKISESSDSHANTSIQSSAEHSFDVLLCHLIYETMKEVLQIRNKFTSFIERVRPGPLSLQAQKLKIPKTKDSLVATVLNRVVKIIPPGFFPEPHALERDKPRLRKWCSRPRELVDEILLEELVEEDYQWTEWWPEEVIVSHIISTKTIQTLIRNALQKRKYVYSQ